MEGDKRRFTRFSLNMNATLYVEKVSYDVDKISNLSIGGCLLPIDAGLSANAPCSLVIRLGMSESEIPIRIEGVIVRSGDGEAAVKFISIDPDSLFHLQMLARFNAPDSDRIEDEIKEHPGIV